MTTESAASGTVPADVPAELAELYRAWPANLMGQYRAAFYRQYPDGTDEELTQVLHDEALRWARYKHDNDVRQAEAARRLDAAHTCACCRTVDRATTRQRYLFPAESRGGLMSHAGRIGGHLCEKCFTSALFTYMTRAGDELVDGRSRAELAADWLDRQH
jgi:hypothetical protein